MSSSSPSGPLIVFAVEPDGTVGRSFEPAPSLGWSSWERFGFGLTSPPVPARSADGRLELFGTGLTGRLGHCWQEKSDYVRDWSHWEEIGPEIRSAPAVGANQDGRLEVFAIGPDACLGHRWQLAPSGSLGWSDWSSFGLRLRGQPAVARNDAGRLEVFAIGQDGSLGHVWQLRRPDGSTDWEPWTSFDCPVQSDPVAVTNPEGRLEVFAIGPDGCLGHIWQKTDPDGHTYWSDWTSLDVQVRETPCVVRNGHGNLEVFAIGPDGCLGHMWQEKHPDGAVLWSPWSSFGHPIIGPPAATLHSGGSLDVFATAAGGRLGHVVQWVSEDRVDWTQWYDFGVAASSLRPAVCPWRPATLDAGEGAVAAARSASVSPTAQSAAASASSRARQSRVSADFCVIGAGPAGITLARDLIAAGASVVLVETGDWNEQAEAQSLNHGDADGPIVKGSLKYLRNGRRRQVQGAASIWGGWCMPFRAIDFEHRPWVNLSGWPLSLDAMHPFEVQAANTLEFNAFEAPLEDGPLVRLAYQFPPNLQVFHSRLAALADHPRLQLELGATAVGLTRAGDRIESITAATFEGEEFRVQATAFVLAAGGIENARVLLHQRVAPDSPLLGRCFMEHPHVLAGSVRVPDWDSLRSCFPVATRFDVLALADGAQRDERLLNASVQLVPTHPLPDLPQEAVNCDLFVRAEQAPNPDSRLELAQGQDRFGWPRPVLHWQLLEADWRSVVRTAELVSFILERRHGAQPELSVQLDQPWPAPPADPGNSQYATWGNHHMGTTRMSDDPATGVVDRDCRVHGVENLYLAGSSVFPTGGCANPTFMIVALAHRLAAHLGGAGDGSVGRQQLSGAAPELAPVAAGNSLGGAHGADRGDTRVRGAEQGLP